jgi:hypothetical protein
MKKSLASSTSDEKPCLGMGVNILERASDELLHQNNPHTAHRENDLDLEF